MDRGVEGAGMTRNDAAGAERPHSSGVADADRPAIQVRHLDKVYHSHREGPVEALTDISFEAGQGEFICVVGPSGCGKSTLLKIIAGISGATAGEMLINGQKPDSASSRIGLVFQAPVLLPWRTVMENTLLPAQVFGLDMKASQMRAQMLLDMVGLTGFERSYPSELSGGMQQRCSITRALLPDPAILLMDEPFGALDAMTRDTMNIELQRIWMESHKTVFLITHSIPEAVFLGDRVLVMSPRPGRIIDDIRIDLPRPRDLDITTTPEFGAAVRRIRAGLGLDSKERPYAD
ncbi:MAG TPA: ABC transporter ATP-binding protein [Devosiaceae bacterium]|jgi:NitT/TauT family transport system ATP-binding protein